MILVLAAGLGAVPTSAFAEPSAATTSTFNSFIGTLESRLARQHQSQATFLAPIASSAEADARLRRGELIVEPVTSPNPADFHGAMLHHWRGTAFAAGAKAADFERLMKDFNAYPRLYAPEVVSSKILTRQNGHFLTLMRVRQHHVITVVMDTTYDVTFAQLDPRHASSISRSTRISEIESPGTSSERALTPAEDHGILWRQNIYWSYEERDGGLYMQIESVSLSRSIPVGLGWAIGPFVESVPRESMEFTLRATCNALRK